MSKRFYWILNLQNNFLPLLTDKPVITYTRVYMRVHVYFLFLFLFLVFLFLPFFVSPPRPPPPPRFIHFIFGYCTYPASYTGGPTSNNKPFFWRNQKKSGSITRGTACICIMSYHQRAGCKSQQSISYHMGNALDFPNEESNRKILQVITHA